MSKKKSPRTGKGAGAGVVAPQDSDISTIPDAAPEIKLKSIDQIRDAWRKIRAQELSGHHDRRATARLRTELLESLPAWQRLDVMDRLNKEGGR